MSETSQQRTSWLYEGIWGVLTEVICVPRRAPVLPAMESESVVSRKPSPGFVRYLKFQFWVGIAIGLAVLSIGSIIVVAASNEPLTLVISGIIAVLGSIASLISYVAIHLRFDTTWYVFSDRSMRLRRGIWTIRESTITFENIQNVKVSQGPLQRFFGIANVVVETAGGGGAQSEPGGGLGLHAGLIEGVAEAAEIRDSIMSHVNVTSTAGLGDEASESISSHRHWSPRHIEALREIRDLAQRL